MSDPNSRQSPSPASKPTSGGGYGSNESRIRINTTGHGCTVTTTTTLSPASTPAVLGIHHRTPINPNSEHCKNSGREGVGSSSNNSTPSVSPCLSTNASPHQKRKKGMLSSISADILHLSASSRTNSPRAGVNDGGEEEVGDDGERRRKRGGGSLVSGGHHHAGDGDDQERHGTVFGLTFNTLTNVMGAGVLSLPFATYNGSIVISLALLVLCAGLSAFSVYALTLGCEVTQKFSYTECLAFTLFPDRSLREGPTEDNIDEGIKFKNERRSRRRRRWATLVLELVIFLNGFGTVTIYSRVIADSMPPVMEGLGFTKVHPLLVGDADFISVNEAELGDDAPAKAMATINLSTAAAPYDFLSSPSPLSSPRPPVGMQAASILKEEGAEKRTNTDHRDGIGHLPVVQTFALGGFSFAANTNRQRGLQQQQQSSSPLPSIDKAPLSQQPLALSDALGTPPQQRKNEMEPLNRRHVFDSAASSSSSNNGSKKQEKGSIFTEQWFWLVIPGIMFFGLSCIRNMDELKWTSIVGFLTILYIVIAVVWRYFTNLFWEPIIPQEGMEGYSERDHELQSQVSYFHLSMACFSTISSYSLAFAYHFNVPYFYSELKDRTPTTMMKGAKIAFPIITICYGVTGLLGYLTFGALVASSAAQGNIVNNFSDDDVLINIGRVGLFFHFATVYPIIAICCRRGLHRIVCVLFSPAEEGDDDENDTAALTSNTTTVATTAEDNVPVSSATAVAVSPPSVVSSSANNNNKNSEIKHPPGDPRTTQFSSIVIEAFAIVFVSTLFAGFASGIGVVIHFVGTLFGTPLVFIFPGLVGCCIFHSDIPIISYFVGGVVLRRSRGGGGGDREDGVGVAGEGRSRRSKKYYRKGRGRAVLSECEMVELTTKTAISAQEEVENEKEETTTLATGTPATSIDVDRDSGPFCIIEENDGDDGDEDSSVSLADRLTVERLLQRLQYLSRASVVVGVIFLVCGAFIVTSEIISGHPSTGGGH